MKTFHVKISWILHANEPVEGKHIYLHVKGFARRLVLTEKFKVSRKSSIHYHAL